MRLPRFFIYAEYSLLTRLPPKSNEETRSLAPPEKEKKIEKKIENIGFQVFSERDIIQMSIAVHRSRTPESGKGKEEEEERAECENQGKKEDDKRKRKYSLGKYGRI